SEGASPLGRSRDLIPAGPTAWRSRRTTARAWSARVSRPYSSASPAWKAGRSSSGLISFVEGLNAPRFSDGEAYSSLTAAYHAGNHRVIGLILGDGPVRGHRVREAAE